jgi:L-amino acid N-acyltransferase YncA
MYRDLSIEDPENITRRYNNPVTYATVLYNQNRKKRRKLTKEQKELRKKHRQNQKSSKKTKK